ncbi:MAG: right-handed parallel beta-helix repeat-containing protein, partial [Phycisphaerae bacterium]
PITSAKSQPTNVLAIAIPPDRIEVTWTDNSRNEAGFIIQRNVNRLGWENYGYVSADVTAFTDTQIQPGMRHCYRVLATDGSANSPASIQSCVVVPPTGDPLEPPDDSSGGNTTSPAAPKAPSGLGLAVADGRVVLSWTDNADNEDGYEVWRYDGSSKWAAIGTVAADVAGYVDDAVVAGGSYCYRVRAFNAAGAGPYGSLKCISVPRTTTSGGDTGGTPTVPSCPDGNCPDDPAPAETGSPVYYVAPDGREENDGTRERPWPSVRFALSQVGGGNTIVLRPGVYRGPIRVDYSGTPERPTVVRSELLWQAVVDGSDGHGFKTNDDQDWISTDWVVVDGLEIRNCAKSGIKLYGDHGTVRNCWIHHNVSNGIEAHHRAGTLIERNLIEYNGTNTSFEHGIYASGRELSIRNNVFRYNSAYGIHLYPEARGSRITGNVVYGHLTKGGMVLQRETGAAEAEGNLIASNTFATNRMGIVVRNGNGERILNNIIAGADAPLVFATPQGAVAATIDFNLLDRAPTAAQVYGAVYGGGNVVGQPNFVDPTGGLFWLAAGSPAIGRGSLAGRPESDFWGLARTDDPPDIGALAFDPGRAELFSGEITDFWFTTPR